MIGKQLACATDYARNHPSESKAMVAKASGVAILRARASKLIPGIHWSRHFLSRNPSIKLKYCQYLEKAQAKVTATVEEQQLCMVSDIKDPDATVQDHP